MGGGSEGGIRVERKIGVGIEVCQGEQEVDRGNGATDILHSPPRLTVFLWVILGLHQPKS